MFSKVFARPRGLVLFLGAAFLAANSSTYANEGKQFTCLQLLKMDQDYQQTDQGLMIVTAITVPVIGTIIGGIGAHEVQKALKPLKDVTHLLRAAEILHYGIRPAYGKHRARPATQGELATANQTILDFTLLLVKQKRIQPKQNVQLVERLVEMSRYGDSNGNCKGTFRSLDTVAEALFPLPEEELRKTSERWIGSPSQGYLHIDN